MLNYKQDAPNYKQDARENKHDVPNNKQGVTHNKQDGPENKQDGPQIALHFGQFGTVSGSISTIFKFYVLGIQEITPYLG